MATFSIQQIRDGAAPKGAVLFISTFRGAEKVTGFRRLADDPWVVCGQAPFTHSYAVHYGVRLYTDQAQAQAVSDAEKAKYQR